MRRMLYVLGLYICCVRALTCCQEFWTWLVEECKINPESLLKDVRPFAILSWGQALTCCKLTKDYNMATLTIGLVARLGRALGSGIVGRQTRKSIHVRDNPHQSLATTTRPWRQFICPMITIQSKVAMSSIHACLLYSLWPLSLICIQYVSAPRALCLELALV
jgi:hypothetical protein